MSMKISLVTMSQGNPIALRRTIESFLPIVDEVIFGDLLVFEEDRELISKYLSIFPLRIERFDFNWIFKNGFHSILNTLADKARNDMVLYMNVSEVIDPAWVEAVGSKSLLVDSEGAFDAYYFRHATEPHHWYRMYNRQRAGWRGLIHEEVHALPGQEPLKAAPFASFQMADTEKDMEDPFKAKVYNDIKELCYFQQYIRLVEQPELVDVTHQGWVDYAKDGYESLKTRIEAKGKRYEAFQEGNLDKYLEDIFNNPDFEKERMTSSNLVNLQGSRLNKL